MQTTLQSRTCPQVRKHTMEMTAVLSVVADIEALSRSLVEINEFWARLIEVRKPC